jgi:hypothetical protein
MKFRSGCCLSFGEVLHLNASTLEKSENWVAAGSIRIIEEEEEFLKGQTVKKSDITRYSES